MSLLIHPSALAAPTPQIEIGEKFFDPDRIVGSRGVVLGWVNHGDQIHTATSDGFDGTSGPKLWDSGKRDVNESFFFRFETAGAFKYHCTRHPTMKGVIKLAPLADLETGNVDTTFTVSWSEFDIPPGFNVDVRVKRPGVEGFHNWKSNRTGSQISKGFVPDAGTGTYKFRARTQNDATGGASDYSPPFSIEVS
jgi:plastocyanin